MWCANGGMGNQIGAGGAEHIAHALEKNTTIKEINLCSGLWLWLWLCVTSAEIAPVISSVALVQNTLRKPWK